MDKQPQSRAPLIIAIVLLLLPVLYVGSYFAMVVPGGRYVLREPDKNEFVFGHLQQKVHYRVAHEVAARIFWPLEQIDRKVRPGAWVQKTGGAYGTLGY
jgi:hypothetical protein